jgi:predicted cytidylate kinase
MRIAISGPPGSGKTTICMLVAKRLDYDFILIGQIFRQMASERKLDLETFGRLAEEDETIDKELDDRMFSLAKANENIVLDGRLSGPILKGRNVPVFAAYIDAAEQVRADRIARRESKDVQLVLREMRLRERSERKRYMAYYGIDPSNKSLYDLWLDSSAMPAEKIADAVIDGAKKAEAENARKIEEID